MAHYGTKWHRGVHYINATQDKGDNKAAAPTRSVHGRMYGRALHNFRANASR